MPRPNDKRKKYNRARGAYGGVRPQGSFSQSAWLECPPGVELPVTFPPTGYAAAIDQQAPDSFLSDDGRRSRSSCSAQCRNQSAFHLAAKRFDPSIRRIEARDRAVQFFHDRRLLTHRQVEHWKVLQLHREDVGVREPLLVHIDYPTFQSWLDAGEPSTGNTLTPKYNKPRKEPLVKKGNRDLSHTFSIDDIRTLATNLHDVLWGGGSSGDTEVFSALVNIILAKIQDEYDTSDGEEYGFQLIQHGDDLERPEELFARINSLYRRALTQQLNKHGPLDDQWVVNKEKFALSKVVYTVGQIEKYSFVDGKNSLNGKDTPRLNTRTRKRTSSLMRF